MVTNSTEGSTAKWASLCRPCCRCRPQCSCRPGEAVVDVGSGVGDVTQGVVGNVEGIVVGSVVVTLKLTRLIKKK